MIARLLRFLDQRTQLVRLVLPIALSILVCLFSFTPQWESVELKGFDALTWFTSTDRPSVPIVIVAIDEPSFGEIQQQWPWPRGLHAKLVDALYSRLVHRVAEPGDAIARHQIWRAAADIAMLVFDQIQRRAAPGRRAPHQPADEPEAPRSVARAEGRNARIPSGPRPPTIA